MTGAQFDYYESACALIGTLKNEGFFTEASELQKAIDEGSTANEIMMALRWCLQKIIATKPIWADTTRRRVMSYLSALDIALQ